MLRKRNILNTLVRGSDLVKRFIRKEKIVPLEQLIEFYDSHGLTPEDVKDSASEIGVDIHVPADFYTQGFKKTYDSKTRER